MDFSSRLDALKKRREGPSSTYSTEAFDSITGTASNREFRKSIFESVQESDGVKYAVVAMTSVDANDTAISIREGERVASSLANSLSSEGVRVDTKLQGSVGLDVHIKGYSDVDMLVLVKDTILIERPSVDPSRYSPPTDTRPMEKIVGDLRARSEIILPKNFPAVDVNVKGPKSIALEGGSLQRKIDIVPAVWYHTATYQTSRLDHDKAVKIFNKADQSFILNFPFLNRKIINDADALVGGNIKRIVRLLKTLQSDSNAIAIRNINSFDVLSIAYEMRAKLNIPAYQQLGLVDILRERLQFLMENKAYRDSMNTPDLTRKVFDNENKVEALTLLYLDCNDLADSLVKEISPYLGRYSKEVLFNKSLAQ